MHKIIKYLRPSSIPYVFLIFVLLFIQAMCDLTLPDYMSKIISDGIAAANTGLIWDYGYKMLLISLLSVACAVLVGFLAARVGSTLSKDLRTKIFGKVESFSNTEFDQFSTASLITRSTNDIQQISMFVIMMLRMVLSAPIMCVGGIIKAVEKSEGMRSMILIIAIAVAALISLMLFLYFVAIPKFKRVQTMVDKLNLITREQLTGLSVIRAFNTENRERVRFKDANEDLTGLHLFVNRMMSLMFPAMSLIMNGVTVAVIWAGSYMVNVPADVGNLMAFIQYSMQIIMSFLMISMIFVMLPRASVSALRVAEVIETKPVIDDPVSASATPEDGTVEFRDVSFRYPGADDEMLADISFTAKPGETTAFIGSTGSGKSTLINLIPRFYDVTSGQILVGGVPVTDITQHDLHEMIGYVPQKGVLFSGTIESNLKFADEKISDEVMKTAASIAQATEFIESKPETYATEIAQGGTNVSGGQKQRLSIARALAKNAKIYIFDDSFSALDFKTDAALRKALKGYTENSTVLIVAQRINTIMNAEQIIVLEEGRMVAKGTHRELLDSCEIYRTIAESQLSKEELA